MENHEFIRRCHVCSHYNESETEILKCGGCGKAFVALETFERIREQALQIAERAGFHVDAFREQKLTLNPLHGLMVFW